MKEIEMGINTGMTLWPVASGSPMDHCIAQDHPIRVIRRLVDETLSRMLEAGSMANRRWAAISIPMDQLVRASLLQVLYSIRCEQQLAEQLQYNLLYRWFVGLANAEPFWDAGVFLADRDCMLQHETVGWLLSAVVFSARAINVLTDEHFNLDNALLQAFAAGNTAAAAPAAADATYGRKALPQIKRHANDIEVRESGRDNLPAASRSTSVQLRHIATARWSCVRHEELTERHKVILRALCSGKTNKRIARELGISDGTVKIHLATIFRILDVQNRTQAAIMARDLVGL